MKMEKLSELFKDFLMKYASQLAVEDIENQRNVISDLEEFIEELTTVDFKEELEEAFNYYQEQYISEAYYKYGLEKNITIDVKTLKYYLGEYDDLEEAISEYLTNTYDFCAYGFNFSQNEDTIEITNIQWDISF